MNSSDTNTKKNSFDCLVSQTFDYYNITDHLPDSVEPTWTLFAVINGIASPPTIVINFLIIWTILEDNGLRKVTYNVLLAMLATTDFFEGLIVEPFYCWYLIALLERNPIPCHFTVYSVASILLGCLTLNTLMVASIDSFLAVEYPIFYIENVSTNKVVIGTAIVWSVNLLVALGGRLIIDGSKRFRKIPIAFIIALNILITFFCTIKVQITAYRQRRAIRAQVQAVQQENSDEERKSLYKQAATMSLIVLGTFLFYCPFIISAIIQFNKGEEITDDFEYISHPITVTFVHLQSLVNPIVMSVRLSYIREGIKNKLQFCRSCNR